MKRIAIIGAGFSGMIVAHQLRSVAEIVVFEKSRGLGGRMSTRYANQTSWDHGLQSFAVTSPAFQRFLEPFIHQGVVAPWRGQSILLPSKEIVDQAYQMYVGVPHMNTLCHALSDSISVLTSQNVKNIRATSSQWYIESEGSDCPGGFDWVVVTAPFPQSYALLEPQGIQMPSRGSVEYDSIDALLVTFPTGWKQDWVCAQVLNSSISSIYVNSSKPARRAEKTDLVAHSSAQWSQEFQISDKQTVSAHLFQELQQLLGIEDTPDFVDLHRWRFAQIKTRALDPIFCPQHKLAATGDWCAHSPKLEDVWAKAVELADKIRIVL